MTSLSALCILCGRNIGPDDRYVELTRAFARSLVRHGITIVSAGGATGLQGVLANAALEVNGKVIGVVTPNLVRSPQTHQDLTDLKVVENESEQKALMIEISQGVIALPGGVGTVQALLEAYEGLLSGKHSFPCGVMNFWGFYNPLLALLNHLLDENLFLRVQERPLLVDQKGDAMLEQVMRSLEKRSQGAK